MKIVSVPEMRALEAAAIASGLSEAELQQRAGQAVAEEVFRLLAPPQRVVVLVGHGNNGRDGAVSALWLLRHQIAVDLVLAPRHSVTVDELTRLRAAGGAVIAHDDRSGVAQALGAARVAVDALAGIGARGALREPLASLASQLNDAHSVRGDDLTVMALDIPSGIDPDTGAVPRTVVSADCTRPLGGVKQRVL